MAAPTDADYETALAGVTPAVWDGLEESRAFLAQSIEAIEWRGGDEVSPGVLQMPWVDYGAGVQTLRRRLDRSGVLLPFDWVGWEGRSTYADAVALRDAPVADALRWLVAVLRGDRFSEGALAAALQDGRVGAALDNLAAWRLGRS